MPSFPSPTVVRAQADVRAFFDDLAAEYTERHGPAEELLTRRLAVLARHAHFSPTDVVLDVGCGPGRHLAALADRIGRGIGVDLSPGMVAVARRHAAHPALTFRVDDAERLDTVPRSSVDTVLCVGVLEHLLRPARALRQAARVLRPGGRFVALTPNGACWWYRLADRLGLPTRHLATDRRLTPGRARRLLRTVGLTPTVAFWHFVPEGDLPRPLSRVVRGLDRVGRWLAPSLLRGGLCLAGRAS